MLNKGWLGALPKALEIDVIHLPKRYIDQRNSVIDMLQCSLATWASAYRSAPENSDEDRYIIARYHETFEELIEIIGEIIGLDPDAELPDELMPKKYTEYWLQ